MKIRNVILRSILAAPIAVALSCPVTSFADELFTVPISPVYQAVKNSSLRSALTQVSQRSGIIFKIDTEIGKDIVHQSLAAADWNTAIKSLLHNYNYTLVMESKSIKTVIITGRAGDGSNKFIARSSFALSPVDLSSIEVQQTSCESLMNNTVASTEPTEW